MVTVALLLEATSVLLHGALKSLEDLSIMWKFLSVLYTVGDSFTQLIIGSTIVKHVGTMHFTICCVADDS